MSEIKALEKLREIADKLDDAAAKVSEHGFSPIAIKASILCDEIEAEIADRYIKLPTDKNGNVIHVGDMVKHADGDVYEVLGVDNDGARQGVFINTGDGRYPIDSWCASGIELYKPRTIEDVLSDLANEVWEASCTCQTTWSDSGLDGIEKRYADEIRELLGGDAE